jgi:hypothetical protein
MKQEMEQLGNELATAVEAHRERFGEEVITLIGEVERSYSVAIRDIVAAFASNSSIVPVFENLGDATFTYVTSMRWVGWGNCELGPPLHLHPVEEYALAMAVYISARLIDDAIDGHDNYKGYMPTLYGFIREQTKEREAAGLGSMMGALLSQAALRRLLRTGHREAALILLELYADVIPGALAETLARGRGSPDLYKAVVQRKSVAYDMMLHRSFLRTAPHELQLPLLHFLGQYSETAQWLNDLNDEEEDKEREQLNIVTLSGMCREHTQQRIASSFRALWQQACTLPEPVRNALAVRLRDPIAKLIATFP